jgi:hypothetical protein
MNPKTAVLALALAGCAQAPEQLRFPAGDAVAGKETLRAMQCHTCHELASTDFPAPHAQLRGVPLGAIQASWSGDTLIAAILAPAHDRPEGQMGDYSEAMTVRQLIDIVAYLQTLGK